MISSWLSQCGKDNKQHSLALSSSYKEDSSDLFMNELSKREFSSLASAAPKPNLEILIKENKLPQKELSNPKEPILEQPVLEISSGIEESSISLKKKFSKLNNLKKEKILEEFVEDVVYDLLTETFEEKSFIPLIKSHFKILAYDDQKAIRSYLNKLFAMINKNPEFQLKIFQKLNIPIGPNNEQRLLINSSWIPDEELDSIGSFYYEPVLDIDLYILLEETLRDSEYKEKKLDLIEMERFHILHKLIFDSLNENLDHQRLYGLKGTPLLFLPSAKIESKIEPAQCAKVLEGGKAEILRWAGYRNGVLPEKEPNLSGIEEFDAIDMMREDTMIKELNEYVSCFIISVILWKKNIRILKMKSLRWCLV